MTDEEISEFAQALHYACEKVIEAGFKIQSAHVPEKGRCCCPLGALVRLGGKNDDTFPTQKIAALFLGLEEIDTRDFIVGFEEGPPSPDDQPRRSLWMKNFPLRKLGAEFRKQYA